MMLIYFLMEKRMATITKCACDECGAECESEYVRIERWKKNTQHSLVQHECGSCFLNNNPLIRVRKQS